MKYTPPSFEVNLRPEGFVVEIGSLFSALELHDKRDARGLRYTLVMVRDRFAALPIVSHLFELWLIAGNHLMTAHALFHAGHTRHRRSPRLSAAYSKTALVTVDWMEEDIHTNSLHFLRRIRSKRLALESLYGELIIDPQRSICLYTQVKSSLKKH